MYKNEYCIQDNYQHRFDELRIVQICVNVTIFYHNPVLKQQILLRFGAIIAYLNRIHDELRARRSRSCVLAYIEPDEIKNDLSFSP
ncbi:Uncharacterised protein [uncultured archaeon]|nr:Uncharacterised protein [uncultured archaeon]